APAATSTLPFWSSVAVGNRRPSFIEPADVQLSAPATAGTAAATTEARRTARRSRRRRGGDPRRRSERMSPLTLALVRRGRIRPSSASPLGWSSRPYTLECKRAARPSPRESVLDTSLAMEPPDPLANLGVPKPSHHAR